MTQQEKTLGATICRLLQKLDPQAKSHALGVLEGMAIMADRYAITKPQAERSGA